MNGPDYLILIAIFLVFNLNKAHKYFPGYSLDSGRKFCFVKYT